MPIRATSPRPGRLPRRGPRPLPTTLCRAVWPLLAAAALAQAPAGGADPVLDSERGGDPLPPAAALAAVTCRLPARITLLAGEPVIRNPVAACSDDAGRLLVAENLSYAEKGAAGAPPHGDRVVMLEDADGDGAAERHATLVDGLRGLSGVAVGRGGLWVL
ncbi:MAG: hypothetical protein ACKO3G_14985, partial [Planctomycetaceae bacterium]